MYFTLRFWNSDRTAQHYWKDYFPFVPNALMGKRMLQWNINCSTTSAFVESKKKGFTRPLN